MDQSLNFNDSLNLQFYPPDLSRYPCLKLAGDALHQGGLAPLVFNAANEIAVAAFLSNRIGFGLISSIIESTLNLFDYQPAHSIEELLSKDQIARKLAQKEVLTAP